MIAAPFPTAAPITNGTAIQIVGENAAAMEPTPMTASDAT